MKKRKPLFTGYDWDVKLIEELWPVIDKIGKEDLKLDYHQPQFDIVTADQMLDAYSSIGMPIFYNHWSFGKSYAMNQQQYRKGKMNLAYEMVINSNPCLAYLMEDNTAMMTALVMAHANVGHAAVFKMNYLFQQHTKPDEILNLLEYFKNYVRQMEEEHGEDVVEVLLDCLHFIGAHGVDKFPRKEPPTAAEMKQRFLEKLETERKNYSIELDTLPDYKISAEELLASLQEEFNEYFKPVGIVHMQEENLLRVIEQHSLTMPDWQIKMVALFRQVEQYFYPQMQTQVLNEGFACFCHYYIMTKLHEEGYIDEGAYLEFLESHTAVCYQHPMAAINPYALGFAMFMDIKRACENPDEEDYKYLSTVAGKEDWRTELKNIVRYYKDESFIKQFLSPKVIRKFQLFALKDDTEEEYYEVTGIQSDDDVKIIRDTLSKQKELDNRKPNLEVVLIDRVENHMTINYIPYNNRGIEGLDTLREMMISLTGMDVDIVLDEDYF